MRPLILTLALLVALLASVNAHAALRPGTSTGPTMPVSPPTGGGSPTLTCVVAPVVCVQ